MKLKIIESSVKEVDIALPYYAKSECHLYKVYSEDKCIQITDLDGHYQIQQAHSGLAFMNGNVECTENEFKRGFIHVSRQLINLLKK